jgi:hypothetical protein
LRRAFGRVREGEPVTPVVAGEDPTRDPAVEEAASLFDTHLLCHSDCEGFYVPVDFGDVIFDNDDRGLAGAMLGSSVRLMAELVEVAPAIGIRISGSALADAEAAAIVADDQGATPFYRERLVWLALYEAARCSIANDTMIVFS